MIIRKLGQRITSVLERMTTIQILILFVTFAVIFSQILVIAQNYLLLGRNDRHTQIVGFITPLIDALLIVWIILVILKRAKLVKSLVDHSNDEIYVVNKMTCQIVYVNEGGIRRQGLRETEIIGQNFLSVHGLHHESDNWQSIVARVNESAQLVFETASSSKGTDERIVEVTLSSSPTSEEHLIAVLRDVTERKHLEERLEWLATTDPLTSIPNRRKFIEVLHREIERSRRYRHKLSILMIDVDHFKAVNDEYGHAAGDTVLKELVETVVSGLRKPDLMARFGGEEFVVLLPDTDIKEAFIVAERHRKQIQNYNFTKTSVTASFGVASFSDDESAEMLLKRVDHALYRAKENGRNRVMAADQKDEK